MGFGKHPHDNMEIISIPLEGDLEHQDNTGTNQVIKKGDVQVMSAGSGIAHSEKNRNKDREVQFLQIWIFPKEKNVTPRYEQKTFNEDDKLNKLATVVSPVGSDDSAVHIHQDAWFSLGKLKKGTALSYHIHKKGNGIYAFVLDGNININKIDLNRRDGLGISEADNLTIEAADDAELLLMEVPMN
jgi:redox-sensitive bicupin YhaK (pirin superfamily)